MWWAVLVSHTRSLDDVWFVLSSRLISVSLSLSLSLPIYLYRDVVYTRTHADAFASVDDAAACAIAVCVSHDSPAWNVVIDVDFSKMRSYGDHWTDLSMIPHDWCIPSDDRLEIVIVVHMVFVIDLTYLKFESGFDNYLCLKGNSVGVLGVSRNILERESQVSFIIY